MPKPGTAGCKGRALARTGLPTTVAASWVITGNAVMDTMEVTTTAVMCNGLISDCYVATVVNQDTCTPSATVNSMIWPTPMSPPIHLPSRNTLTNTSMH
jgi:hypothetical protein